MSDARDRSARIPVPARPAPPGALAGALVVVLAAFAGGPTTCRAWAQAAKPAPWKPVPPVAATAAPKTTRTVEVPEGVTLPIAPLYQPSVTDSVLPFHIVYRELAPAGDLSYITGALQQGLAERRYHVVKQGSLVALELDGGRGGSHLALVVLLPWIDRLAPAVACPVDLAVRWDGGAVESSILWFTPGPMLHAAGRDPIALSTPGLVTLPIPPGKHRLEFRFEHSPATFVIFQAGVPQLMPLPVMPEG